MSIISYIILALIGLIMASLAVAFVWLIGRNMKQGREVREKMAERVKGLRMAKMVAALGVDLDTYLHQAPLSRIGQSMRNCEQCATTSECDQALQHEITPESVDFCPNQSCLGKLVELQNPEPARARSTNA